MSFIICKEVLIVTYLMSAILGLVQGVAEFLPISSSGHLTLLQHFFGMEEPDQLLNILLHFATLLAVCVFANMYFQSVGKAFRATILAVCRNGVMIPLVYILCWRFGLTGLEWTQTLADVVSFAISAGIFVQYFRREFGREDLGR